MEQIGRAPYIMERIGPELRQYVFASDTDATTFNRNERSMVYRKAKNIDSASSSASRNHSGNNACPIGITTRHPEPQHGIDIDAKANRVCNYVATLEYDLQALLSSARAG